MVNSKMDGKRDCHYMLCNNQPLTSGVELSGLRDCLRAPLERRVGPI